MSFAFISATFLFSLATHFFIPVSPGVIVDFIGEVPSTPLMILLDLETLILQVLCLLARLQEAAVKDEDSEPEGYEFMEVKLDLVSIFQTHWNFDYRSSTDTENSSDTSPRANERARLPV